MHKTFPLSLLVERHSSKVANRNQAFVRGFCRWLHERADMLRIPMLEQMGICDVVLTFQMKKEVKLIITGVSEQNFPGEITISIHERDFPFLEVEILKEKLEKSYEVCSLDYAFSGRSVHVISGPEAGQQGTLLVAATIGVTQQNRVKLANGEVVTLDGEQLEWH